MHISEVVNNRWVQLASVGVVAFAGGTGIGYIWGKKKGSPSVPEQLTFERQIWLEEKRKEREAWLAEANARADAELGEVEETVEVIKEVGEEFVEEIVVETTTEDSDETGENPEETPEDIKSAIELALEEKEQALNVIELRPEDEDEESDEVDAAIDEARASHPTANVFDNKSKEWDYTEELKGRSPESPYILHQDEFYSDERGYAQQTLTYYAGDQILVDEHDKPIYNYGSIVGELNFGHGSNDPNVVYVRNEKQEAEYEILLDSSSFEVSVLGYDENSTDQVEHSFVHKFRADD